MASPGSDDGVSGGGDGVSAAAAVVCCMCGDHGLPRELFRCNLCRLRTQHRYCSDLYPSVAGPYRSCNWCLKQGGAAGGGDSPSPVKALAAAGAGTKRRINDSRGDDDRDNDESACYGCSRSAFSADPGKPIKKPKKGRERAVRRPEPVVTTVSKKKRREVQPGKPRFKVKVRRYKLLAEVIC
ncbi:uncharacterized protein [Miscanthus floridulus]|uniref:uncharacterized protein isoform X1 n=1 Tax=Miscanthus floridulus TaxID=154761 RepID=UPI00345ABB65